MRAVWRTIGRTEELALATVETALRRGVVVAGAPGVGKSRLVHEVLEAAERDGRVVRRLAATASSATVPLGALAPALPGLDAGRSSDRFALLRAVVDELTGGDEQPVIGIDDAHLLDDLSATAVHQVALSRRATIVAAVTAGSTAPEAVQALWKDGHVVRLELQPLAQHETDCLVGEVLGGIVAAPALALLWDLTEGNPLFVRELVVSGLESGALAEVDGVWRWRGAVTVTTRLGDLIEDRVGRLDEDERSTLVLLAFGEPLGLGLLDDLGAVDAVGSLERRRIVALTRSRVRTEARLTQPLYGEVVRRTTPVHEARAVQARLAEAVERRGARRARDTLRIATWRVEAGVPTEAALLVSAAEQANAHFDHELAERLALAAQVAAPSLPATLALGVALIGQERFVEADELLAGIDLTTVDDEDVVHIAEVRHIALAGTGDIDRAEAMLVEADRHLTGGDWFRFLEAERSALLVLSGRYGSVLEAETLLADTTLPDATRFRALSGLGVVWALTGQSQRAVDAANAAAMDALAARERLPRAPGWVASALLIGQLYGGDLDGADRLIDLVASELPGGFSDAWERLLTYRGAAALLRGKPVTAARWLRESAVLHGPNEPARRASHSAALLAQSLAMVGEADEAAEWAARGRVLLHGLPRWFEPALDLADAWVHVARHELTAAVEQLEAMADRARESGGVMFEVTALHDLARLGEAAAVAPRLTELATRCDGLWVDAYAAHATALVARDGPGLDVAADRFEAIGALLDAAEASAAAARYHDEHGLRARATASTARAAALASACEGARTPALAGLGQPVKLSRREREVAMLAASGLSNRDIAARLSVSVRTVEGHLYQAYTRLGVSHRDELAKVLSPSGVSG